MEAPPVVRVAEATPLAAVVDGPARAEAMVVNDPVELVEINLLVVSVRVGSAVVVVAPVVEVVETVEPETDDGVGPGIPLLVTNDPKISENSHRR